MSALLAAALQLARPFVSAWAAWRDDELSSMPRPHGLPRAVADGPSADRILLIGSGPAAGWGVASHDLALPGALARALRARTGRGAVVDVITEPAMTAASLAAVFTSARLDRYDAVVTTVGTNDALHLRTPREWRVRIDRALDVWTARVHSGPMLLMVGIVPVRSFSTYRGMVARAVDRLALVLNAVTEDAVECIPSVHTTILPALGDTAHDSLGRFTRAGFAFWADQIAAELVDQLNATAGDPARPRSLADRMTSGVEDAEEIAALLAEEQASLERIVTVAAAAFSAPTAVVTVLGPDTQFHVSRFGIDLDTLPIEHSFCAVMVRNDDGMVVPDTTHDPRFAQNPLVVGDTQIGYYLGVPLEDPHGRRIGSLCVLDTKPRNSTSEADMCLLRGLAEQVQGIVWATIGRAPEARRSSPSSSEVREAAPESVCAPGAARSVTVIRLESSARLLPPTPQYEPAKRPVTLVATVR